MKDLDSQLPTLMTRATEGLEPESVDLVERSVAQGLRARQRRGVLAGAGAGVAVLATLAVVVGAVQHFDSKGGAPIAPPVAGPMTPATRQTPSTPVADAYTPPPLNLKDPTLQTLRSLLAGKGRTLSSPETWGSAEEGFYAAGWVVDDGKGKSRVQVLLQRQLRDGPVSCKDVPGCRMRADGSAIRTQNLGQEGRGVISNFAEITRKDGRFVSLTSYNAVAEKGSKPTRPAPILSVKQLTKLADDNGWKFPVKATK